MTYPRNEVMKFPSGKAGSPELTELVYPRLGSIKFDGSFCLVYDGELYSRNLIPHPNRFLRDRFAPVLELGQSKQLIFMGEIFDPTRQFSEGQSITRSYAGEMGNSSLFVFDCMNRKAWDAKNGWLKFATRYAIYRRLIESLCDEYVLPVYQEELLNVTDAILKYQRAIADGHEGLVTRDANAYYKFGRCTKREADLFRHTELRRVDAICLEVLEASERKAGVVPPKLLDGRVHRSFKQDDSVSAGTAGSLRVRDRAGREYGVGFGQSWTAKRKLDLWRERDKAIGKIVEIEHKVAGEKDVPRQAKLVRFRDDKDEL